MKGTAQEMEQLVPMLALDDKDAGLLRELADTLVAHNLEAYNTLLVSPDGHADARRWKELRRKDGIRVYKERAVAGLAQSPALPCLPSLLLLGTLDGTLEDLMLAVANHSDESMRITSKCVQDGVLASKVVQPLVAPSEEQPFRHVSVKWRLYGARDYVSVDATGMAESSSGERVGYSISHSVDFSQLPSLDKFDVERANMSVCALYRQRTPETVECYVRGFYDFRSDNSELLTSLSMNSVAAHWLAYSKYMDCANMKKLVWRLRKNEGLPASGPLDIQPLDEDELEDPAAELNRSSLAAPLGKCAVCARSFGLSLRKTCKICWRRVCSGCSVKKLVCVLAPDRRSVLDKKRTFCSLCVCEVAQSDALAIARDEIRSAQTPESNNKDCAEDTDDADEGDEPEDEHHLHAHPPAQ